ncbi:MAG: tail fiber domain-containing protein [Candidatus Nanoarchaeia archaeon]|nr:tail fiber domain-containing protein [Candidatus Nanoarchaeia archaeon]
MKKIIPIFTIILMISFSAFVSSFSISNFLQGPTNYVKIDSANSKTTFNNLDLVLSQGKKIDFNSLDQGKYYIRKAEENFDFVSNGGFQFKNAGVAGVNRLTILADGKVGIGTDTPGAKLQVNGDIKANAFYYNSDLRLKTNISVIENPIDKIMQLEGVEFNWKENGEKSIGLIAQEVEKVFPEIVSSSGEYKSVGYANLVAPLIEAVKYQQKEIKDLEERIKLLEEKLK